MKKQLTVVLTAALLAFASESQALLISGGEIISAPAFAIDDAPGAENRHQQGFNERQGVVLPSAIVATWGGTIPAGTVVDSHMIFLNTPGNASATDTQTWSFSGTILGIMHNAGGTHEANTSALLGAVGTVYPSAFGNRGLESGDSILWVTGNEFRVRMQVTEPGDWIRVITASVPSAGVPDAGTSLALMGLGVAALALVRRRN